jgi:hypothetical protein
MVPSLVKSNLDELGGGPSRARLLLRDSGIDPTAVEFEGLINDNNDVIMIRE